MIARCPFVDVIAATTRDDATTPLAALERHEWGDPVANERVWRVWRDRLAPLPHVRHSVLPTQVSVSSSHSPLSNSAARPTMSVSLQAEPTVASNFYPHALISSSLHDSRVPFSDALKWTAALRDSAVAARIPHVTNAAAVSSEKDADLTN